VERIEPLRPEQIVDLFRKDRAAEYEPIRRLCESALAAFSRGSEPAVETLRRLQTQLASGKRELDRVSQIDYLHAPEGDETRALFEKVDMKLRASGEKPKMKKAGKAEGMPPLRSLWVTRPRPHIDRIGSAWLIKRFYDPHARFSFAKDPTTVKKGVPFDVLGVEFGHHGEDCTFETVLSRLGIKDRALRQLAEIVHEADLRDGKFTRSESAGFDLTLLGLAATHADDQDLLEAGMAVFDGMYAAINIKGRK
jgi:hypothetical protein